MVLYVVAGYVVTMWILGWMFIRAEIAMQPEHDNAILIVGLAIVIIWPIVGLFIYLSEFWNSIDTSRFATILNSMLRTFFRLGD